MNKKIFLFILAIVALVAVLLTSNSETDFDKKQKEYAAYLTNHPYSKRKNLTPDELKAIPKKDRPDLAFEQDFLRTMDPNTKKLHQDRLVNALKYSEKIKKQRSARKSAVTDFNWESRGPKQVAGRVRAMMFDPNDTADKRVFAGGVSGGIWKNEDITDENSPWSMVYPEMSNFAISAMDFDPVQTNTFYLGTGEGWRNVDAVNGAGIWKTTDAGATWSNLASTTNFEYVYDLIVRDEGGEIGVIYAAMQDLEGINSEGTDLFRSEDGGITWTIATIEAVRDLELGADNKIWAGTANGSIFSSTDGTTWTSNYTSSLSSLGRVELAAAPSNSNVVYAIIASNNTVGEIVKTIDSGANWTNIPEPSDVRDSSVPNDDFSRGQAWYDLIINVSPSDENEVYVGGINTFKTLDSGDFWFKISSWESFYDSSVSYAHADIHNIIFRPNHNQLLISTDGGIFYSPDNSTIQTKIGIVPRNLNFNITQYYSGALDPINDNIIIGGAQDNGTTLLFDPGISDTEEILGGDGGFSFIDQTATNATESIYRIASTQRNVAYLYDSSDLDSDYVTLINNSDKGNFINSADYDDENNVFYSFNDNNEITRAKLKPDFESQGDRNNFNGVKDIITASFIGNRDVTHIRVSPYNKENRKVFLGTDQGRFLVINTNDDTVTLNRTPNVIGAISCIEIGATEDERILTYSNYGVKSVWYTIDGAETWIDVEGNLPDIPVRWSLFNPLNRKQVLLATEAGIWKTEDITADSVVWEPASEGMGNVRVDMLQYRASDNLVLAATHGRGMFTTNFTAGTASIDEVVPNTKAFTVYPTISNGNFTVFAKSTLGNAKLDVFDISGRQVYTSKINFSENEKQSISLNATNGIYIVNLTDEKGKRSSKKIVIQ
ncbi:T9SS type A sorting domain-containing protein [uncultured Polaribacter sp.]|uniref:WD40/YVTN/BNR-like repeat-containing protein n=2 Tax=Polaribacter TaxID=52959 RepID=UPI00262D4EB9|nr:T9SS type A sorting domain-containing protein [uncultured Polaribacter sp.]